VEATAKETRTRLPKLFTLMALAIAAVASRAHVGDEEPFWAKGRPHSDAAGKMAPVAAKSIPTPKSIPSPKSNPTDKSNPPEHRARLTTTGRRKPDGLREPDMSSSGTRSA